MSWSVINGEDLDTEGVINAAVETSAAFFAAGSNDVQGVAMMWASDDGASWRRVHSDAFGSASSPFEDSRRTEIRGLASHSDRIVAVGVDAPADSSQSEVVAAVWYSLTGATWVRVAHDPAVFGPNPGVEVNSVIAPFAAGFVAVGSDAWTSRDGIVWERHDLGDGTASTVIETDDGLLAGGTTQSGGSDASTGHAAVWMSTDIGSEWTLVTVIPEPSGFDASLISGMTRTDDGFVAVGAVADNNAARWPAVWSSEDGATWELTWVGERSGILRDVAATATRLVAVGEDTTDGLAAAVWQSADSGATWLEDSGQSFMGDTSSTQGVLAVSALDDTLLVAGQLDNAPTMWVGIGDEAPPTTAELDEVVGWTCQARIENGAAWVPGAWDEDAGSYVARDLAGPAPASCVDVLDIHTNPRHWRVAWKGTIADQVEVGLLLVFEQGIHGAVYEEREIDTASGVWITEELDPDPTKPFTFVAMPHSFDDWESITFTITPCTTPYCR
jgi:hypothetical protein